MDMVIGSRGRKYQRSLTMVGAQRLLQGDQRRKLVLRSTANRPLSMMSELILSSQL